MVLYVLMLIGVSLAVSAPLAWLVERAGKKLDALDTEAAHGQKKDTHRRIPNTGGIAIFWGVAGPAGAALLAAALFPPDMVPEALAEHLPGLKSSLVSGLVLLGCLTAVHVLGLIDDRRPLGPMPKLGVLVAAAAVPAVFTETRLLTGLDGLAGGPWLSVALTVFWILLVTNAMNFMDNMDGLSAGVGMVCAACFLTGTLITGQWFIAGMLALLVGSLLGFLWRNAPPAKLFMGDGGSLVLGYLLGFLTVRTTYYADAAAGPETAQALGPGWYGALMPLLVLAVPVYDLVSVVVIRVSQGKSPLVGDLQHTSHRLVARGLSKRRAVVTLCGLTAVTGMGGIMLATLQPWQAVLVGVQCVLLLIVLAVFELGSSPGEDA